MSRLKEWINVLNDQLAPWLNWKMGLSKRQAGLIPAPAKNKK